MRKSVLVSLAALLILFVAITLVKSRPDAPDAPDEANAPTAAEKENVRRFWTQYRQATDHRMAGRLEEAAAAYQEALALNDRHEDALYYLGNMYLELGAPAKARSAWERLTHVNPHSARAHARLGDLYLCPEEEAFFDLEAAGAAYRRALDINKEETGPLLRLGQIALLRGDLSETRYYLDAVIGSNYKSVDAYVLKGYVAWKEGRRQEAASLAAQAAHHARPEAPPQGVAGEGDTRPGTPLTAQTSRCQVFEPFIDDVTRTAGEPDFRIDQGYRKLDAFLERVRAKTVPSS